MQAIVHNNNHFRGIAWHITVLTVAWGFLFSASVCVHAKEINGEHTPEKDRGTQNMRGLFKIPPPKRLDIMDPNFEWPMRWLYLGAHGELFTPGRYTSPSGINELAIKRQDDGGFMLVHTGPKWSGTYAVVHPNCRIEIILPVPEGMDRMSAALLWPYKEENGLPAMPPHGAVIAARHAVSPSNITPPDELLGWLFLCADGDFYWPAPKVPVHANTLWVVKKDGGFQFIRTGPVSEGEIFAKVMPDRKMTFSSDFYKGKIRCWGHVNTKGEPVFHKSSSGGKGLPEPCDADMPVITVHPDGSMTAKPKPIP